MSSSSSSSLPLDDVVRDALFKFCLNDAATHSALSSTAPSPPRTASASFWLPALAFLRARHLVEQHRKPGAHAEMDVRVRGAMRWIMTHGKPTSAVFQTLAALDVFDDTSLATLQALLDDATRALLACCSSAGRKREREDISPSLSPMRKRTRMPSVLQMAAPSPLDSELESFLRTHRILPSLAAGCSPVLICRARELRNLPEDDDGAGAAATHSHVLKTLMDDIVHKDGPVTATIALLEERGACPRARDLHPLSGILTPSSIHRTPLYHRHPRFPYLQHLWKTLPSC